MTLCTLVLLMAASERESACGGPPLARWRHCFFLNRVRCVLPSVFHISVAQILRCKAMSFPEKQAREAWALAEEEEEEEEGNEEEKEPAIVERV